jgi:hypothetical protein
MSARGLAATLAVVMASVAFLAVGAPRAAQAPAAAPAPRPSVYNDYHPNLSDMMTMLIQPRHTKLGLGLRTRNWAYAAYEAGELRGAFRRVVASMPTYEGKDTAEVVSMIGKPLDDMVTAARARDPAKADAAYAELTATCNMCHEAQGRTYIVIQAPAATMFPDQDFRSR